MRALAVLVISATAFVPLAAGAERNEHGRPAPRAAPVHRERAMQRRPMQRQERAQQNRGFDLHNDIALNQMGAGRGPANQMGAGRGPINQMGAGLGPVNRNNGNNRNNVYNNNSVHNVVINNPGYGGPAWGWNGGAPWAPQPVYWGGGFWGGFATAVVMGVAIDASTQQTVTSYRVAPNSPGASLLANYKLRQVPCGNSNLVVLYGPSGSVICANPNNLVGAGAYNINLATQTIQSK